MTQAFNLSQLANNLNTAGQLDATDGLTGAVSVANGGTGQSTLTANAVLLGNGTSGVQAVAPSTSGNVLVSNGTTWVSSAPSGGGALRIEAFSSSGTWTAPSGVTRIFVQLTAGGTGGYFNNSNGNTTSGYAGATAVGYFTVTPNTAYSYTVSAGGNGYIGGASDVTINGSSVSFSSFITITAPSYRIFDSGNQGTTSGNTVTGSSFGLGNNIDSYFISFNTTSRGNLGTSGVLWSTSSTIKAGSQGTASSSGGGYASGGVGGAIILMYVG
jgi:hypothetical protein